MPIKLVKTLKKIIPILIIICLTTLLFGQTLFPPQGKMIYGGDIYDAYFFWKSYLRESIISGVIPFWNPYNFSGTPFLAHPNINLFYPPNWLFVILPLNISFSVYFFLHFVWAGLTMYWLARQYTDRWGATAAGIIFSLGGYFAARVYSGHLEYVDTASWIPLIFGLVRKTIIHDSWKNILTTIIGMMFLFLSGNELFLLFTMELISLYALYWLLIQKKVKELFLIFFKCAKVIVISFFFALGLAAVEVLPRMQFMWLSLRSQGLPYNVAGAGSLPFSGLRLFLEPFYWGMPFRENYSYHGPWPDLGVYNHYVGILPILLIFFFIVLTLIAKLLKQIRLPKVHSEIWFFLLVVIPFFLLISFGTYLKPNFHELLWRYTPLYKGVRLPARHLFIVALSLSLSTGLIIGSLKTRLIKMIFIVLISVNLLLYSKQFFRLTGLPTETFDTKLIETIRNDHDLFRVLPDFAVVSPVRRDLDFGAASMYKIQTTSDYNSMVLWRYYHFIDLLNQSPSSSLSYYNVEIPPLSPWSSNLDFLNIKYVLTDKTFDLVGKQTKEKYRLILENERYKLYQNQTLLPRFFFVNQAQVFDQESDLEKTLRGGQINLGKTVLLTRKEAGNLANYDSNCQDNSLLVTEVISHTPNKIVLKMKTKCDGFLSSSEIYYPGWKAKIDNSSTKILLSNLAFRSIFIPKGNHAIQFYYEPAIYFIGGLVSVASLIILFFFFLRKRLFSKN